MELGQLFDAGIQGRVVPQHSGTLAPTQYVKKIKANHHKVAQLLASGMGVIEVSRVSGLTPQRITQLQQDPMFQTLLDSYVEKVTEYRMDMVGKLADLGENAIDELSQRLEASPEQFKVKDLMAMVTISADRTYAPPQSKTYNVTDTRTVNIKLIQEAKQAALGESKIELVEDMREKV